MSTLKAEKNGAEMDNTNTLQATETAKLVDCGRVTKRTQGVSFLLQFEPSAPPFNRLWTF